MLKLFDAQDHATVELLEGGVRLGNRTNAIIQVWPINHVAKLPCVKHVAYMGGKYMQIVKLTPGQCHQQF